VGVEFSGLNAKVDNMEPKISPMSSQEDPANGSDGPSSRAKPKDPRVRGVKGSLMAIFKEDGSILKQTMAQVLINTCSAIAPTEGGAAKDTTDENTEYGAREEGKIGEMFGGLWFTTTFETKPFEFKAGNGY